MMFDHVRLCLVPYVERTEVRAPLQPSALTGLEASATVTGNQISGRVSYEDA